MLMRRYFRSLCLLVTAGMLLVSCLDSADDTETILYSDTAITAFSLTSSMAERHTTSSKGEDSMYYAVDKSVSAYPFYIDHLKGEIYNVDSLPHYTDITRLLCEVYTKNGGSVVIENEARDSMMTLTTTDSIDFTKPRYVRVYSSDMRTYREYTVTVNKHKENGDDFVWARMADNAMLAGLQAVKALTMADRIVAVGLQDGVTKIFQTNMADGNSWTMTADGLPGEIYNNVAQRGDTLFAVAGGQMMISLDGATFSRFADAGQIKTLVGASTGEMYAIGTDGNMMVSADGGLTWQADATDGTAGMLPATDVAYSCAPFGFYDNTDYAMMAGNRADGAAQTDTCAVVWRKIVSHTAAQGAKWSLVEGYQQQYALPKMKNICLFNYEKGSVLAFGGAGIGGSAAKPYSRIYESRDGGVTWKSNHSYVFPADFNTAAAECRAVVDRNNNIWLVSAGTGQVYRGKLNRMSWEDR